jgi:peptidoglycan/LPS O-acetylase OafA/YrhL
MQRPVESPNDVMHARASDGGTRLVAVDSLRGLAAMAVVMFHMTTRMDRLYPDHPSASQSFALGHFGVNLFFIISGFVIFMTLARTERPMDFVVSRFSRLYPAYWASIVLTFVITHALGLPGKLAEPSTAALNMLMFHGLLGVPHVDGVYWTLEVELLFYAMMLFAFRVGALAHIHRLLLGLLALRLLYLALARFAGIDLSWTLSRLLILDYIAWFALGICIYQLVHRQSTRWPAAPLLTAATSIVTLAWGQSLAVGLLAVALASLVWAAAADRVAPLRWRVFTTLGALSYPLYLLHENIGWSVQLALLDRGVSRDAAVLAAVSVALLLAAALTRSVEQPALRTIRARYRRWRARS